MSFKRCSSGHKFENGTRGYTSDRLIYIRIWTDRCHCQYLIRRNIEYDESPLFHVSSPERLFRGILPGEINRCPHIRTSNSRASEHGLSVYLLVVPCLQYPDITWTMSEEHMVKSCFKSRPPLFGDNSRSSRPDIWKTNLTDNGVRNLPPSLLKVFP